MPGICGIIASGNLPDLRELFDEMLKRMRHHSWYRTQQHIDSAANVALGRVSLGFVQTAPQPMWHAKWQACCVMEGELYNTTTLRQQLSAAGVQLDGATSHAEILLQGFLAKGRDFLRELNGTFIAAIWDGAAKKLHLLNDRFGMKPLYYAALANRLLFASEIKSLLADAGLSRQPNPRGMAQFFSFGQLLVNDTLLNEVKTLPPAGCLTYDQASGKLQIDRYWRLDEISFNPAASRAEFLDRLESAFRRAVQIRTGDGAKLGISLSGGLDSRSILAAIDHQHVPITSVSMGVAGGLDHRCAQQMSDLTNRKHHRALLDSQFLARFPHHMQHMVHLTDGHYLDQCIVIPTLPKYRELGIEVLLRGHAGELMHMDKAYNFSLDAAGWAIGDEAALHAWLRPHMSAYMLEGLTDPLLVGVQPAELQSLAANSLDEALADSDGIEPQLHRIWHLFITQRLRRETAMSMAKIGTMFETRLPFLDNEVIAALLSVPPAWKRGDAIQSYLLEKHKPEFLRIINANTGVPLGSPKWRRKVARLQYKVFGKLGLPGYQPYERLGLWLRRELKPWVSETLLSERTLQRGVFEPNTVRKVVEEHNQRINNHTALIMALLIYEFGQREFIDGDEFSPSAAADHGFRQPTDRIAVGSIAS